MAVRRGRGARLRRVARGRAGFLALALAVYSLAAVSAASHRIDRADDSFLAAGAPGHGEAAPGDHLQTVYHLWLVGSQLERGAAPWRDPYSFRPESAPTLNFAGWPYGLAFWPLAAAFGPVLAWNVLLLLTIVAAGGLTCVWLRELGLPRGPALAGGLTFALAPYRIAQSGGHLLGWIAVLLPFALWCLERGLRGRSVWWLAGSVVALASIPLSGQVHLALAAVPFYCAYALVRSRRRPAIVAAVAAAVLAAGAGLLVRATTIAHSELAEGRSLHSVGRYSATWGDLVRRHRGVQLERFVYLGWAAPVLAAIGLALLLAAGGRRGLGLVLGAAAVLTILLALGTHLPLYGVVWHAFPPLRYPRVPGRLLPVGCLALAALVAYALARAPRTALVSALAVPLLFLDLHVNVLRAPASDEGNAAYAALRAQPPGRLLELPVFLPDLHYGSVYEYYDLQARRERPGGYSTVAPRAADTLMRKLRRMNCGRVDLALLRRLDVRYVTIHHGLYLSPRARGDCEGPARVGLAGAGFRLVAMDGAVQLYAR